MWNVFRTLGLCATLFAWGVARDVNGEEHHGPLFPDCCELDADYDWFEPIDCNCPSDINSHEGMFFTYERMNWNVLAAPRYAVGQAGMRVAFPNRSTNDPLILNPPAIVPAPEAPTVGNAIDVAQPDSEFGWGNRFELGYSIDQVGWTVGVLSNFEANDSKTYGVIDPTTNLPAQDFTGSVAVLFRAHPNLLVGFVNSNGDQDNIIDNVDGDNLAGDSGINGTGTPQDYGDLYAFLPTFDLLTIEHSSSIDGVELMRSLRRDNFYSPQTTVEFLYGLRFLRVDNEMRAVGVGALLANSYWQSDVENKMFGPQVGLRWNRSKGRWAIRSEGRFMGAMNVRDASLNGTMGTLMQPGRLNKPFYMSPTSFAQYDSDYVFSPVGEIRLEAIFNVTQKFALKVGYTGTYASNMGYGSNMVDYTLPALTLRSLDDIPTQHFFSNGVNFGFEINR